MAFELEQEDFSVETASEPGERSVGADDAVAGNGDAERIRSHGLRDGPESRRTSDSAGDVAVGGGFAVGNLEQRTPDAFLEGRSAGAKRQVEGLKSSREVVFEGLRGLFENRRVARHGHGAETLAKRFETVRRPRGVGPVAKNEGVFRSAQTHHARGRLDFLEGEGDHEENSGFDDSNGTEKHSAFPTARGRFKKLNFEWTRGRGEVGVTLRAKLLCVRARALTKNRRKIYARLRPDSCGGKHRNTETKRREIMTERKLLIHGDVVTMNARFECIEDGAVLIKGKRIEAVGKTSDLLALVSEEEVERIDCFGKMILPGLIDAHTHAGHCLNRSLGLDSRTRWMDYLTKIYHHSTTPDYWYAEGRLAALERLKAGITCGVSVISNAARCDDPRIVVEHVRGHAEVGTRENPAIGPSNPPYPRAFAQEENGRLVEKRFTFDELMAKAEEAIELVNRNA